LSTSCFADRFGDLVELTPAERLALGRLEERTRPLKRGAVLVRENDPQSELFILTRGTAMSYVLLDDGSRQILRFLFPGDMVGFSALIYQRSVETIAAVSDCVVSPFERQAMTAIVTEHPRLAALIMAMNQMERVALTDRLVALGRTSAKARVAALLLEIRDSVAAADGPPQQSFILGLTQEEIGDATGLTAVHVNRMLRQLDEEGLIARENGRVTFLNEGALARIANYINRFEGLDLGWLPAGR
jgi:CRP/FNR family transcriptional regulator, anaerobic regulatory protein